jgi:hypothetical protein
MRRTLTVLSIAIALGLLAAAPAGAKPGHGPHDGGIAQIVITGDDVDLPIRLTREREINSFASTTHLSQSLARFVPTEIPAPRGELGPRYDIAYNLTFEAAWTLGVPMEITQRLYPFAEGGPVLFTPEQRLSADGWWPAADRLTTILASHGIAAPVEEDAPAPSPSPSPFSWIAALLFVAGGALVLRRARRAPSRVL